MDDVERVGGQLVVQQIVTPHLEDRAGKPLEEGRVEVHRQHRALGADPLGHPCRDRAAARAGFQTAPAAT